MNFKKPHALMITSQVLFLTRDHPCRYLPVVPSVWYLLVRQFLELVWRMSRRWDHFLSLRLNSQLDSVSLRRLRFRHLSGWLAAVVGIGAWNIAIRF